MSTTTRETIDWTSHRKEQQAADVADLVAHGATLEEACVRVGVKLETLQTRDRRAEARTP